MNSLPFSPSLLLVLATGFVGGSILLMRALDKQEKVRARITGANDRNLPAIVEGSRNDVAPSPVDVIAKLGSALARSGLLPAATRVELEQTLAQAGLRGGRGLGLFLGSKVVGVVLLPLLAYIATGNGKVAPLTFYTAMAFALVGGLLLPDFVLRQVRAAHLKKVERGLPDALDMLVICAQAGLALENAIERVAIEFASANRAVSEELAFCASELRIGSDRRAALTALGERTGLDTMKRFAATLIQTMQFGTPLTHALRVLASEMRTDALTRFEEKAARLPVLLTFPMILFVLPCVFIVVVGPAAIRVTRMFPTK
ncbi:MAG TPA: type II secretion system F family protein [Acetobacteraceae bacterium]|nr:type II secretion system F family protein [Acetobacteraceae bacterium]